MFFFFNEEIPTNISAWTESSVVLSPAGLVFARQEEEEASKKKKVRVFCVVNWASLQLQLQLQLFCVVIDICSSLFVYLRKHSSSRAFDDFVQRKNEIHHPD